jgi:hypothetical protein
MELDIPGTDEKDTANDPGVDDKKVVEGTDEPENQGNQELTQ